MKAAYNGDLAMVGLLVDRGANPLLKNMVGIHYTLGS